MKPHTCVVTIVVKMNLTRFLVINIVIVVFYIWNRIQILILEHIWLACIFYLPIFIFVVFLLFHGKQNPCHIVLIPLFKLVLISSLKVYELGLVKVLRHIKFEFPFYVENSNSVTNFIHQVNSKGLFASKSC